MMFPKHCIQYITNTLILRFLYGEDDCVTHHHSVLKGAIFMSKMIAVTSGKGGTGKSSICAGIGYTLAKQGSRTLIIELDFGLAFVPETSWRGQMGDTQYLNIADFHEQRVTAAHCNQTKLLNPLAGRFYEMLIQRGQPE